MNIYKAASEALPAANAGDKLGALQIVEQVLDISDKGTAVNVQSYRNYFLRHFRPKSDDDRSSVEQMVEKYAKALHRAFGDRGCASAAA